VRRRVLSLVLISLLTFFFGLGRQAIGDSDEGFYAEAAREMVETNDWLTPRFNYEDRWQKPALYYWLTAATYLLTGPTETAARLWAAVSGIGLVLLTWAVSRQWMLDERSAWLAGAIVATCYGYFAMARASLPDLPLAFCVTLTVFAATRAAEAREHSSVWMAGAGLAAALGFLFKGPVAVVVPAIVVLPIWWRERRSLTIRPRDVGVGLLVFVLVGLPWYAAMALKHGTEYLQSFFIGDNFERFATDRFNDPRPFWFYAPIVIGGMMPWAAYLLVLPARFSVALLRRQAGLAAIEWRLLLWAGMPLVFFTLSVGKQPRYILPVLPPLAILLAQSIVSRIEDAQRRPDGDRRDLRVAAWLTAAMFAGLAAVLFRDRPLFITTYPALTAASIGGLLAAAAWLAAISMRRVWELLPAATVSAAVVMLLAAQFGALSGRRPEAVEEMASLVRTHRTGRETVGEYQVFVRNLIFYARFNQTSLFSEESVLDFMRSPDRVLLVVRPIDLERLEAISGVTMKRLGQVEYFNTANMKLRTLLWPIPSEDLQTVFLVTNQ
jgi:4-amino-4-deoxy-L-arabinose transferase-like glycosyltransferase